MARKKQYIEEEVIEKAMHLFWRNGYQRTSMQMLEEEMGINKFSIYASFGSKNGVFIESMKCYKQKLFDFMQRLRTSTLGVSGIKDFFYDFIDFSKGPEMGKGCLVTNTANEIREDADQKIKEALENFTQAIKQEFKIILKQDPLKSEMCIEQQADFLVIAMFGLSSASRLFTKPQLDNYIENIFINL